MLRIISDFRTAMCSFLLLLFLFIFVYLYIFGLWSTGKPIKDENKEMNPCQRKWWGVFSPSLSVSVVWLSLYLAFSLPLFLGPQKQRFHKSNKTLVYWFPSSQQPLHVSNLWCNLLQVWFLKRPDSACSNSYNIYSHPH